MAETSGAQSLLYPRDSSLDPQLVWIGKDEQDRRDFTIPLVPIFIQEQIAPRAIIENLRAHNGVADPALFDDFGGLDFDQRVDFYQHNQRWTNRMILGDSLLAMASLGDKEGLKGKVQMIYLDPPYGIKFRSNWQVSTRSRDVKDGVLTDVTPQPEQIRAFRDTWNLGINSYLAYMRDRLFLARSLLTESGSIFVQIGDDNVHLVRCLLDEVFRAENYVAEICLKKPGQRSSNTLPILTDFILWYAKDKEAVKYRQLYQERDLHGSGGDHYTQIELQDGTVRPLTDAEKSNPSNLPEGARIFQTIALTSAGAQSGDSAYTVGGKTYKAPAHKHWSVSVPAGMERLRWAGRLVVGANNIRFKNYLIDFEYSPRDNRWDDAGLHGESTYVVQTSTKAVQNCILMSTDPGDLVLDPTCGSGTTAFVAEQWGRRWITIDTSRVALALTRTRLMSARYPYYLLSDSPSGVEKERELSGIISTEPLPPTNSDVSRGFVNTRAKRVTREGIAKNPDLREGMTRAEVDAAIARHADAELLYDQPIEDKRVVRVAGPFTVESLSPHRPLTVADPSADPEPVPAADSRLFLDRILDNLRRAGVQNTVKNERLIFSGIEPWPGVYVQAVGNYSEAGQDKRAAICVGPEYGTVGAELIREAAKEASKFTDVVIVCGFAFEAMVGEESTKLGRIKVLRARMNPDLSMGDDLLKKTGAGNLFMVFGEPDIAIEEVDDVNLAVEILGLDIYDPTTGAVKSHNTDEIACWFIDTNYDEASFFVRHAYFVGAGDPYEKLRKALRSEINEDAWQLLYRTKSAPFKKPDTGKIAVKVINHYGDEVLKVYRFGP